ncbi:midnolin-B [Denticeps clupeoides]|uniref:Ubiquitin-like domain-containing protein n=1 Tax=Denticeps clupeoides TaxID=299321 RepID=A0AAY4EKR6_9TELE|nr:midnolin-B-like [Denticeps clupeoides]
MSAERTGTARILTKTLGVVQRSTLTVCTRARERRENGRHGLGDTVNTSADAGGSALQPPPDPARRKPAFRTAFPSPGYGLCRMAQRPDSRSCTIRGSPTCCPERGPAEPSMNLSIQSTTGTRFDLSLPLEETVEGLKRRLSQRLKVPKDKLALLHKDTRLNSGKLQDFGIADGSRLTLVPSVEAGLMSQSSRPEQSIVQALESLTEAQVSDFLCGRSPLTLALRVGDHMMFVQLQLAAQQSSGSSSQQPHQHHHLPVGRGPSGSSGHFRAPHHAGYRGTNSPSQTGPAAPTCSPPSSPTVAPRVHPPVSAGPSGAACTNGDCSAKNPSSAPSTGKPGRKPGAIIESFVNHAPGVFSGTFSGTLHPNCQDSSGRPRRDISTILQILNDLLSATRHYQSVPASLSQLRCPTPSPPPSPSPSLSPYAPPTPPGYGPSATSHTQGLHHSTRATGERSRQTENRATRCKVERLQLLMQQRRLRRKARRDPRAPYAWLPNRKAARSHSNSSMSSDGSLDLDYEDSVWTPDVPSDMNTEFVVA